MKRRYLVLTAALVLVLATAVRAEDEKNWYDAISVYGVIDARAEHHTVNYETEGVAHLKTSDVYIYWAELGADLHPNEFISGKIAVLGEEYPGEPGDLTVSFDKAYLTLQFPLVVTPYVSFGRQYLPVGNYASFTVSDSTVFLLTETWKTAGGVGLKMNYFNASFWYFNGDVDLVDKKNDPTTTEDDAFVDNLVDDYAARLDVYPLAFQDKHELAVGGYFLSDALETTFDLSAREGIIGYDGATPQFGPLFGGSYNNPVPLWGAYLWGIFPVTELVGIGVNGEYATTGEFAKDNYLNYADEKTAISAVLGELAVLLFNKKFQVGGRYEAIRGVDWLGTEQNNPEYEVTDYTAASSFIGIDPFEFLHLGFQFRYGWDNENNTDGLFAFQTKLEF